MPIFNPEIVYYEEKALEYELGKLLRQKYANLEWIAIENHNNIPFLREKSNREFVKMKRGIVVALRKTHKFVPNQKTSDFLVPYTSSGCSASCLYCYLVCNYNKCSYLRIFVNREQMLSKIIKTTLESERNLTFEIGSNSDLVLENEYTGNLEWTIETFGKFQKGFLTLPTKFDCVDPLLSLSHFGRTIIRMSVNPEDVIRKVEFGTSSLENRIIAINKLCEAGYPIGLLIAPVIFLDGWQELYTNLVQTLKNNLSQKAKSQMFLEVIFMTYSYIHRMINSEAFPNAIDLFDKEKMTGRGMGKYWYKEELRTQGEVFFRTLLTENFPDAKIEYIV